MDAQTRNTGVQTAQPVTICDNVWRGGNVTVLPGVTIGEGAVIGQPKEEDAGSAVVGKGLTVGAGKNIAGGLMVNAKKLAELN